MTNTSEKCERTQQGNLLVFKWNTSAREYFQSAFSHYEQFELCFPFQITTFNMLIELIERLKTQNI